MHFYQVSQDFRAAGLGPTLSTKRCSQPVLTHMCIWVCEGVSDVSCLPFALRSSWSRHLKRHPLSGVESFAGHTDAEDVDP